jgi:hypothetical protein
MSKFAADEMLDDLAAAQQSWARNIELNLARITRDLDTLSTADEPHDREGRLVLQQALKHGAAALAAMPGFSSRAAVTRSTQPD